MYTQICGLITNHGCTRSFGKPVYETGGTLSLIESHGRLSYKYVFLSDAFQFFWRLVYKTEGSLSFTKSHRRFCYNQCFQFFRKAVYITEGAPSFAEKVVDVSAAIMFSVLLEAGLYN